MNWLQFISSIVGSLAWPIAVIVVALIFRGQIVGLLQKLQKLEGPGGLRAIFAAEVTAVSHKVEEQVGRVELEPARSKSKRGAETARGLEVYNEVMLERPSVTVLRAWDYVADEVQKLLMRKQVVWMSDDHKPRSPEQLLEVAGVPAEVTTTIRSLQALRNRVAATPDFEPDGASAIEYANTANRVGRVLAQIAQG